MVRISQKTVEFSGKTLAYGTGMWMDKMTKYIEIYKCVENFGELILPVRTYTMLDRNQRFVTYLRSLKLESLRDLEHK